jgi:hypothetical protein
MTKYLSDKPFSLPTCSKPMDHIDWDLMVLNDKEFCAKYTCSKWAYKRLLQIRDNGGKYPPMSEW